MKRTIISQKQPFNFSNCTVPLHIHHKAITVVTAYWNIGGVTTANGDLKTNNDYEIYMASFQFILNPVVAYFDDSYMANRFRLLRGNLATEINLIKQNDILSFSAMGQFNDVVIAQRMAARGKYIAVTHAKYSAMWEAALRNPFITKYFAWLDISYFKDMTSGQAVQPFQLLLPPGFMEDKIAFNAAGHNTPRRREEIFEAELIWVTAGLFIGAQNKLITFCRRYHETLEQLLKEGLYGADEQVLYAMYSDKSSLNTSVSVAIQEYRADPRLDERTSLGVILRDIFYRMSTKNLL